MIPSVGPSSAGLVVWVREEIGRPLDDGAGGLGMFGEINGGGSASADLSQKAETSQPRVPTMAQVDAFTKVSKRHLDTPSHPWRLGPVVADRAIGSPRTRDWSVRSRLRFGC